MVDYLKSLGEPNYVEEILEENQMTTDGMTINASGIPKETPGDQDELYDDAVAWVTESRKRRYPVFNVICGSVITAQPESSRKWRPAAWSPCPNIMGSAKYWRRHHHGIKCEIDV